MDLMQSSMQVSQNCSLSRHMARLVKSLGFEGSFWMLMGLVVGSDVRPGLSCRTLLCRESLLL